MTDIAGFSYIGQKFSDRYQVVRELGRGSMAVVFQANDEHLLNRAARMLIDHPGRRVITE